jgi:sporulation related protein
VRNQAVRRFGGQWIRLAGAAVLLTAYPPNRLAAQSDPRLLAAVQLMQNGRGDSARAVVRRLLATLSPQDSVYPEALYTQGLLAPDASVAETNLQRVIVEYGWSPWADDALLRLAQLDFAQSDPAGAAQSAERLRRDYPESPVKAKADFWGARGYFALKDDAHGCVLIQEALAGAGDDVEFKNQVSFYGARCAGVAAPVATTPATPPPSAGDSTAPAATAFAVQVLAVKSAAQVDDMLTRLRVMGFVDARVIRDTSGFFKVRVGRVATRQDAQRLQQRLKTRLGGQPFVVEEP